MRRAPADGYDFSRKRDYRRRVWATFRDRLKAQHIPIGQAHALLMPSLEGDEIETAINVGFKEYHLHIVDFEPAIVATLKRRYPRVNTYGVSAARAMGRLARNGVRIHCANYDFCNQISVPFQQELARIALLGSLDCELRPDGNCAVMSDGTTYGVFADYAVVAVSQLRGRESKKWDASHGNFDERNIEAEIKKVDPLEVRSMFGDDVVNAIMDKSATPWRMLLELPPRDRARVIYVSTILGLDFLPGRYIRPNATPIRAEWYNSTNGQTMLWSVHEIDSIESQIRLRADANKKRVAMGLRPVSFDDLATNADVTGVADLVSYY